jgi:hypothetical protein
LFADVVVGLAGVAVNTQPIKQFAKHTSTVWGWLLWGLRWLAVVVFIALLLIGIAVKLPWKVLVCLAVIPVVGIFVPKKVQPAAWLALTVLLVAAWVWVKLPGSASGQWQVYQFDAELAQLQADRRIDTAGNAATGYQALFATFDESIFNYPVHSETVDLAAFDDPWTPARYPFMAEWLARYHPGIDSLLDITRMVDCRFPIPRDLPATEVQMKRINQMKGWAHLLLWSANLDITEGRIDTALDKQRAVLAMARHLYQQQNLLDQASAFQLELQAARAAETYMIRWCDEPAELAAITEAFGTVDTGWAKSWAPIVAHEKLLAKNIMGLFYEVDDRGRTRIAHSAMFALQEGLGFAPRKLFIRQHEMNRLAVIGLWLSLPTTPERIAKLIDERFDHYSLLAQKGAPLPNVPIQYSWRSGLNVRSAIDWLALDKVKYFWALHGQHARHEAVTDVITTLAALKTYYLENGVWPESLAALQLPEHLATDKVFNQPYCYRKTADGFQFYSLGPNGIDDYGINNPAQNKDDIVFWPRLMTDAPLQPPLRVQKAAGTL